MPEPRRSQASELQIIKTIDENQPSKKEHFSSGLHPACKIAARAVALVRQASSERVPLCGMTVTRPFAPQKAKTPRHLAERSRARVHCMRYWTTTLASAGEAVQPDAAVCTETVSTAPAA